MLNPYHLDGNVDYRCHQLHLSLFAIYTQYFFLDIVQNLPARANSELNAVEANVKISDVNLTSCAVLGDIQLLLVHAD